MIILTGNNLGERHKELNEIVNKTDANIKLYETVALKTDVDYFYAIDLAARQKNVEFIVQILESGDIVHITRVLNKCIWLSNDEFAHIMSVENLHNNIFPLMSIKTKKKLLCFLALNVKTNRAISFYEYCMSERLYNIALKFLMNTSETYKLDVILQKTKGFEMVLSNKESELVVFIGNSFTLADTFLANLETSNKNYVMYLLRYLYLSIGTQYLDLLEKYFEIDNGNNWRPDCTRFGRRVSKDIIKKHKERVLKNPLIYLNILNKEMIARNSTVIDAKLYAVSLMPEKVSTFWDTDYYKRYRFIIDIIPADERFMFVKKIFSEKYGNEKFEMSQQFHSCAYYNLMSKKEKEIWALTHITTKEEILGCGNDYMWYEYISFDKAFEEIKKYINKTPDNDSRLNMIIVLTDSATTQTELETLLNYFYKRHVNETIYHKTKFLDNLITKHDVLNFDGKCWSALENIFHSMEVFSNKYMNSNYRDIALVHYIIYQKTVPETLQKFVLDGSIQASELKQRCRELYPEKQQMVFQYVQKLYLEAVESSPITAAKIIVQHILHYLDLLHCYSKCKDEIAEKMIKYITMYNDEVSSHRFFGRPQAFSEKNIMQLIKKDAKLIINEFPSIRKYIETRYGRTNWLLKKLKVYFHHDIAKQYLKLLNDYLSNDDVDYRMVQVAVYGVCMLADESFQIEFMEKYAPTNSKIDHANISRNLLRIQEAICSYLCICRPKVPLTCVNQYLAGDYVQYCLPMFNSYVMNLPLPECITFVETLIDKPISIQKHGLRLAFQCFSVENLKTLLNDIWKRTKNISMRKILYSSLFDKVLKENGKCQLELFEVLNKLTLELHQDDDEEVFSLLSNYSMPSFLKGQYLLSGWNAVKKLPERTVNFERKTRIITSITNNINLVPEDEIIAISNDHLRNMLDEKEILNNANNSKDGLTNLIVAKWKLTQKHLTNVTSEKQLENKLVVVRDIIKKCTQMRDEISEEKYVVRQFCTNFIRELDDTSYDCHEANNYPFMKIMFDNIIKDLEVTLPEHEIYTLTLQIRLSNITRDIVGSSDFQKENDNDLKVLKTAINRFSENFVEFLKKLMHNGKYFSSFRELIVRNVNEQLDRFNSKLGVNVTPYLSDDDLSVIFCSDLLKFEETEIYLLILMLLPLNYSGGFSFEYKTILSTVKAFNSDEVKCYMFQAFVNADFQYRNLI